MKVTVYKVYKVVYKELIEEGVRENSRGFATYYLAQCGQAKSEDEIDIQVYAQLVEVHLKINIS